MRIHGVKHDSATLSLHGNELWKLHHLLLAIINANGSSTDGIASNAFSLDSKVIAILELMGKVEED